MAEPRFSLHTAASSTCRRSRMSRRTGMFAFMLLGFLIAGCTVSFSPGSEPAALPTPTQGTAAQREEAEQAARRYLQMIDRGDVRATWAEAGTAMRAQVNESGWKQLVKLVKKTDGVSPPRALVGVGFTNRVDVNAPEGEYAIVQFGRDLDEARVSEKIVMQREQAQWKLVGFFVNQHTRLDKR